MSKTRIVLLKEIYYDIFDIERAKIALCKYLDIWMEGNKEVKILGMSFNDIRHAYDDKGGIAEISMIISEEK